MEFLWNFWDGLCENEFKSSYIASHLHYNTVSCIVDACLLCWNDCVLVGLDWVEPMMFVYIAYHMLMHFHAYVLYILYILIYWLYWYFSDSLSLSRLIALWHLNENLLCLKTLFISKHPLLRILLPLMFDSMMIKPDKTFRRTFLDEAFIRNAKSFC